MMMNESKILTSLEECKKYFHDVNLNIETNIKIKQLTIKKFSEKYNNQLFYDKENYENLYTIAMENEDYDFHITKDNGIFQFYTEKVKNKLTSIHYIFYSNPKDIEAINELIGEEKSKGNCVEYKEICALLDIADNKKNVLYFRYDYDIKLYKELIHPLSHIHIGFDNEIRIPLDKVLTPEAFIDFVIKYAYKENWQKAVETNSAFVNRIKILKSQCESLQNRKFTEEERKLLHIT